MPPSQLRARVVPVTATTRVVERFLVAPSAKDSTVKINIAWCENDYQLDIALEH